ncbi:CD59 glycoprotein [Megalobrama amblycephala]|uniref:CD59 glycoprotein n=1 Tax=Megalobrama amblycephala TaxID=75352 RepID=UPI002013C746|nr:CD59 glycoprotein [Megalobrama amblycephala]
MMKCSLGLFLLVCCLPLAWVSVKHYGMRFSSAGSSLRCYKCEDYTGGHCTVQQVCSYEDACLYLHEKGGKTIRRCIRYTDCDNSRLSQQFPSISEYTYRCCNTDLCNSGPVTAASTPFLYLLAVLSGLWSCSITV